MEEWKPVVGYAGLYEVSDLGRVRSLPRNGTVKQIKVLKLSPDKDGYLTVFLRNKTSAKRRVHNLVLEAFKGPRPRDLGPTVQCRHLDDNKINNTPKNLSWGTALENYEDSIKFGKGLIPKIGEECYNSKLTNEIVRDIYLSTDTQPELAKKYNIDQAHISAIKLRKVWTHVTKDLGPPGKSNHPMGKRPLSEEDARDIFLSTETQTVLAKRYNVNQTLISAIKTRKVWTHVTENLQAHRDTGHRVSHRVITEDDAREIYLSGETQTVLAARYGLSQGHVSAIKRGIIWRHVTDPLRKE
jgi:NUMOD4 motif/HNH endonuclease